MHLVAVGKQPDGSQDPTGQGHPDHPDIHAHILRGTPFPGQGSQSGTFGSHALLQEWGHPGLIQLPPLLETFRYPRSVTAP